MTHRSGGQWPESYRAKPAVLGCNKLARSLSFYQAVFPLSIQYKFAVCLALLGPPTIAFLLFALLPVHYRAKTNVVVASSHKHSAKSGGEAMETVSQIPNQDLVNAEADLLGSPLVAEQTLAHFGVASLYSELLTSQAGVQITWDAAMRQLHSALRVVPIQNSGVIHVTFEHANANTAAKVLNQLVLNYQISRANALEARYSRASTATIMNNMKDLEQLERAHSEIRTVIGTPDLVQQREMLVRQRADTETRLRQTTEHVRALSIRLVDLAQTRSRMVADSLPSQIDNRARASRVQNVAAKQNLIHAAVPQLRDQIANFPDESGVVGPATTQRSSAKSAIQIAPRLLNQFMTQNQGLPTKAAAGAGLAAYQVRIAQALRDLDSLEQKHGAPKPAVAPGWLKVVPRLDLSEQPLQPESDVGNSGGQRTAFMQSSIVSNFGMVPTLAGTAPVTIAAPEVWTDLIRWLGIPSNDDQSDPLIQRLPVSQAQVGGARVVPAKQSIAQFSDTIAIDRDRVSAQAELDALLSQQTIGVVSIGLIDQKLVHLGQADLRLSLLNARIVDQRERVITAQRLYDNAKAAENRDQVRIGDVVQTSSDAISVDAIALGPTAFVSAFASLFLSATMLVIVWISGRRSIAKDSTLELFFKAPSSVVHGSE